MPIKIIAKYGVMNVKLRRTWAPMVPVIAPATHSVLNPIKSIKTPHMGDANADIK